jgi:hypothetical protein
MHERQRTFEIFAPGTDDVEIEPGVRFESRATTAVALAGTMPSCETSSS